MNKNLDKNEIIFLGASLRAIEPKFIKQDNKKNITRIWFQGSEPYFDVFFELKDHEIIWFQFTLRGQSLSWDVKFKKWKTGNTNELKSHDVNIYPASKIIEHDYPIDLDFLNVVRSILQSRAEEEIFAKALALFS